MFLNKNREQLFVAVFIDVDCLLTLLNLVFYSFSLRGHSTWQKIKLDGISVCAYLSSLLNSQVKFLKLNIKWTFSAISV